LEFLRRTWAEVRLDCLRRNLGRIAGHLPAGTRIMGVVKADGYGHGDRYIARELTEACGLDFLAVSNLEEALSLRRAGIGCSLLILGFTPVSHVRALAENRVTQAILSLEYARMLDDACRKEHVRLQGHLKLDTGMGRIGIPADAPGSLEEIAAVCALPRLDISGIFSHFSSADALDDASAAYTRAQAEAFQKTLDALRQRGLEFPCRHLQNSAGIAFCPQLRYEYARAGIVMYGEPPSGEKLPFPLEPVMELKTVVSMVKEIRPGASVSYGRTFTAERPMRIATVPIGYADGYPRLLSNRASMLLRGRRVPVTGNVCMDQLMLDVTGVPDVQAGDVVTVVGRDGGESVTFSELASLAGTISYELMCLISRRVPRVYLREGREIAVVDYLQG
jgi:alanine racemase